MIIPNGERLNSLYQQFNKQFVITIMPTLLCFVADFHILHGFKTLIQVHKRLMYGYYVKVKVNQSHYRPGVAQSVLGSLGSQIS